MALSLDKRVLGFIRTHPKCQRQSVQRAFGISKQEINQVLYGLESKKLIQRTFSNPPLWCLYQKPLSSSLRKSDTPNTDKPNDISLSNSADITNKFFDYLPPVSLLNFIAAKYSLDWNLEERIINPEYQVIASLTDPTNAARSIKQTGDVFASVEMARYSASLKLLDTISRTPQLPFCDLAVNFMKGISKEHSPQRSQPIEDNTIHQVVLHDSPPSQFDSIFSPFSMNSEYVKEKGATLTEKLVIGSLYDKYKDDGSDFIKFRSTNMPSFDFEAFQLCFHQVTWELVCAFINKHANRVTNDKRTARIIFGVTEKQEIQGIRLIIPPGCSKADIIDSKRTLLVNHLVESSCTTVQPPETRNLVAIRIEEVFSPSDDDNPCGEYFNVLVEYTTGSFITKTKLNPK